MIAITGLIGAGKSLVSAFVREAGFEVLDADSLAHKIYAENSAVREKILNAFGEEALNEKGINRTYISQIVFSDKQKLQILENIIYPEMQKEIERINPPFLEAAVLYKWLDKRSFEEKVSEIWVVKVQNEIRKKRLLERGLKELDIEKRMENQRYGNESEGYEVFGINFVVIENNGTREELKNKVSELIKRNFQTIPNIIKKNIPLAKYTTFKIGGNAKFFAETKTAEEVSECLKWCKSNSISFFVLGRGSNVLFDDNGYDGLVIVVCKESLHSLIQSMANQNLGGLEKLEGIPGTVCGAIYMNAGAHGQQICDCILSVTSITENGEIITRAKDECEFDYRKSIFQNNGEIILSAKFKFTDMPKDEINKTRKEILKWRNEKQPLKLPNAGSVFKNPVGYSAGALIENCGLKGFQIGGAKISAKHANFIVNAGNATAKDVKEIIKHIKNEVKKKHNIDLQEEIVIVPHFSLDTRVPCVKSYLVPDVSINIENYFGKW